MFDFFDDLLDKAEDLVEEVTDDPIGFVVDSATKPIRDGVDVIDGLTEGELRTKAILSLGVDVASGMALSELLEWYSGV